MTNIAILYRPGYLAIMTGTTVLTIDNFQHIDLVTAGFHLEAEVGVTDLATETDTMKPVRKNHRAHAGLIGVIIHQHITILGNDYRRHREQGKDENYGCALVAFKHAGIPWFTDHQTICLLEI
jgi:hypothetical protein